MARRRQYVDPEVQGTLVRRVALYWVASISAIILLLTIVPVAIGTTVVSSEKAVGEMLIVALLDLWPLAVSSLLVLPFILYDAVRVSNRFAGPIFRLRRAMKKAANGEKVELVRFRDGDFWFDFAEDFNQVVTRIEQLEQQLGGGEEPKVQAAQPSQENETADVCSEAPISA